MRIKIFCGVSLLLMLNAVAGFGQTSCPCGCSEVDAPCPLDTWIVVMAAIALVFGAMHLYRKGKRTPAEI